LLTLHTGLLEPVGLPGCDTLVAMMPNAFQIGLPEG
jgi:hypothetical protein